MKTVAVATQNVHKAREVAQILHIDGWDFKPLSALGITTSPAEDATTFEGNARIKARSAWEKTGLATLADDSGLVVDALDGAPGVFSSRYAGRDGDDAANNAQLLAELERVGATEPAARTARFVCVIVFIATDGTELVATGSCEGRIAGAPEGAGGFGYDPLFLPEEYGFKRSMASLTEEQKNAISHRGRALAALKARLDAIASSAPAPAPAATSAPHPAEPAPAPAQPPSAPERRTQAANQHRLVVFDFDGTILEGHSPVSLTHALLRKRVLSVGAGLKVGLWGLRYKLRLPAEQSVVRRHIFKSFVHLPAQEANQMMADLYATQLAPRLRPAALAAIEQHRQNGEKVILVSASFRPILEQVTAAVGAYHIICTEMEVVDGYYTGNVVGEPPEGEQKLIQLNAFADEHFGAGNWVLTRMYGDHYSDEYLMDAAQHPVAVNPDSRLARDAKAKGWQIVDWVFIPKQ